MDLNYNINTKFDPTGSNAAAAALENQTGSIKGLKVDTSDLSDETKRSLGLLEPLKVNLNHAGKAAEEAGISHRELKKVLMEVGNTAAPGMGRALSELAFGPVGAALALVSVFELLKKSLEDSEAELDKIGEAAAEPNTAGIKRVQDAWDNATKAYGEYLAKLKVAGQDDDPVKTEIDRAKEITKAKLEAEIKNQEAAGNPALADYYRRNLAQTDQSSLIAEQMTREKQQAGLAADASRKSRAAIDAETKYKKFEGELQETEEALDEKSPAGKALKEGVEAAVKKLDAAMAQPEMLRTSVGGALIDAPNVARDTAIAEAQSEVSQAQEAIKNNRDRNEQLKSRRIAEADEYKTATDKRDAATGASEKNLGRIRQLPGEIDHSGQIINAKNNSDAIVGKINEFLPELGGTLRQSGEAAHLNTTQILEIARQLASGQMTHAREIAGLKQMIAQTKAVNDTFGH